LKALACAGDVHSQKLIYAINDYVKTSSECLCCDVQFDDTTHPDAFVVILNDGDNTGITACRVCTILNDNATLQKRAKSLLQTVWKNVRAINPANVVNGGGKA
jgi:hypothetical protein